MGVKVLSEYLDKKSEEGKGVNWENNKKHWIKAVNEFYEKIITYLEPYKSKMKHKFKEVKNREEYIGEYNIKQLHLDILGDKVFFEPIGYRKRPSGVPTIKDVPCLVVSPDQQIHEIKVIGIAALFFCFFIHFTYSQVIHIRPPYY